MTDSQPPLTIGHAARILGVSLETLRRWEAEGKIVAVRTPGGQRRFHLSEVNRILDGSAA